MLPEAPSPICISCFVEPQLLDAVASASAQPEEWPPPGEIQVTKEAERVGRSVALPMLAYLLLPRLYGWDGAFTKEWNLFKLKEIFIEEIAQEAVIRTELKWQRKVK
jgi:hypothetical protein